MQAHVTPILTRREHEVEDNNALTESIQIFSINDEGYLVKPGGFLGSAWDHLEGRTLNSEADDGRGWVMRRSGPRPWGKL